jgi:hypothetical protein
MGRPSRGGSMRSGRGSRYAAMMSRRQRFTRNLGRTPRESVPTRGAGSRYVRFCHADEPYGVFSYLTDARRLLSDDERVELDALVRWFSDHLEEPACLVPARVSRRASRGEAEPSAVCWFRADAGEHVVRARRLSVLVRRARISIIEKWSDRVPGQICSEDADQLAVASFWD